MPIINTIEGNLIKLAQEGTYTEIAHGCNCFCVMGAGIAPQIAKAFPEAEKEDNTTVRGDKNKLGTFTFADVQDDHLENTLTVYNLYTQFGTGGRKKGEPDIDYDALRSAFTALNNDIKGIDRGCYYEEVDRTQVLGIPMIGAGLAGGDWEVISKIINEVTPDVKIELVVYKP